MTPESADSVPPASCLPFRVTASGGAGLSRAQARSARFASPSRGIRVLAAAAEDEVVRATSALMASQASAVIADISAAALWDLPLPPWIGLDPSAQSISVAQAPGGPRPERPGTRGRRLRMPASHVVEHRGLRVTSPARTWLDCAEHLPLPYLVAMGDVVLRRRLATPTELAAMVRWARRRRGVVTARQAVPLLDPGAESPGESLARCALIQCGVPRPQCNVDIVVKGEWLARADMAWIAQRVIVEYDGIVHLPEDQRRRDWVRRNRLQGAGWMVIVVTASDLQRPERMAGWVKAALAHAQPR